MALYQAGDLADDGAIRFRDEQRPVILRHLALDIAGIWRSDLRARQQAVMQRPLMVLQDDDQAE